MQSDLCNWSCSSGRECFAEQENCSTLDVTHKLLNLSFILVMLTDACGLPLLHTTFNILYRFELIVLVVWKENTNR